MKDKRYWDFVGSEWVKRKVAKYCDICSAGFLSANCRETECGECAVNPMLENPRCISRNCMSCNRPTINRYKCPTCNSFDDDFYITGGR